MERGQSGEREGERREGGGREGDREREGDRKRMEVQLNLGKQKLYVRDSNNCFFETIRDLSPVPGSFLLFPFAYISFKDFKM